MRIVINLKLVFGLGNVGKEYINTRHNIGFMVLDNYLSYKFSDVIWKDKFNSFCYKCVIEEEDVIFIKPKSFMNLSGEVVAKFVNYYHVDISDILIICDDMNLNIGNLKLKMNGSSGGHNGLKNIELNLGTSNYKRLKIGISKNNIDVIDYVLGKFSNYELDILGDVFDIINKLLDDYFIMSFDCLMNKYNVKNK